MEIKKISAFTLMEVTIAMLLTSIAVSITYTAYRIVSRSYVDYAKKQETLATFLTADKLLKQDFLQAKQIVKLGENRDLGIVRTGGIDIIGGLEIATSQGMIRYVFKRNYFLRDQFTLRVDTFKLTVKTAEFFFENLISEEGGRVDQLHFETQLEGMPVLLNYKKLYSAQDLFE